MIRKITEGVGRLFLFIVVFSIPTVPFLTGVSIFTLSIHPDATIYQQLFIVLLIATVSLLLATPVVLFWFIGVFAIVSTVLVKVWVLLG